MIADFEYELTAKVELKTDSSAALGVVRRKGNGKLRHIRVGTLWIQEKEESGEVQYNKVDGEYNMGDLMTKGLCERKIIQHMESMGMGCFVGRG